MAGRAEKVGPAVLNVLTGEADIDISEADYTTGSTLLTITPQPSGHLEDCVLLLDLSKVTTGFAAGHIAQTLTLFLQRKVDGTNWRFETPPLHAAVSGTAAANTMARINIGPIGLSEEARILAVLSAEVVDVEFPYAFYYTGLTPTITAVAAA